MRRFLLHVGLFTFTTLLGGVFALPADTIRPGDTVDFTHADFAREDEVSVCGGLNTCAVGYDTANYKLFVVTNLEAGVLFNERVAQGTLVRTFHLSGTSGREVSAILTGNVRWDGCIGHGPGLGATSGITITVSIYDTTDNRTVASQRIHSEGCDGSIVETLGCAIRDTGSAQANLAATLVRGNAYELRLTARTTSNPGLGGISVASAFASQISLFCVDSFDGFVGSDGFRLAVERDLAGELDDLKKKHEEDIARLTMELEDLRQRFNSHTHVYRTGIGVGHNNTNASTAVPDNATASPTGPISPGGFNSGHSVPEPGNSGAIRLGQIQGELLSLNPPAGESDTSIGMTYRVAKRNTPIRVEIYDVTGRRVRSLENTIRDLGEYGISWDRRDQSGTRVSNGIYLVQLQAGHEKITKKIVLVR